MLKTLLAAGVRESAQLAMPEGAIPSFCPNMADPEQAIAASLNAAQLHKEPDTLPRALERVLCF